MNDKLYLSNMSIKISNIGQKCSDVLQLNELSVEKIRRKINEI